LIAKGVYLPFEEAVTGGNAQRVMTDGNSGIGRGMQPDHLRAESGRMFVLMPGRMMKRDLNAHSPHAVRDSVHRPLV